MSAGLQIEEWSSSSSDMYFVHSPVGKEIVNSVGNLISSEYELLDAYEAYSGGETNTVTIKVKAIESGSQWIKYRTAFDAVDSGYAFIRDPTSGPKDQQGWHVYEIPASTGTIEEEYTFVAMWPKLPQPWYFDEPCGIAVDSSGNVFVAEVANNRIQKFDSHGNFITKWGCYGTGDGEFDDPNGIAVDSSGNVFVVDRWNHRIQNFDSNGNFITTWGRYGTGDGEFKYPFGIAVDSSGNVFIADLGNHRIQKFDSVGNFITEWGSYGTGDGEFDGPRYMAVDRSGNVFVVDRRNHRIQKFDSYGNFIIKWGVEGTGNGEFKYPFGIAVDNSGNVFVADTNNNRIQKFDSVGNFITEWGVGGTGDGEFDGPIDMAVDRSGNVFVADTNNNRIQKFNSYGNFITNWRSYGTGDGVFFSPAGITVDSRDNVLVADFGNDRIQKFDFYGNFITKWGGSGTGDGEFEDHVGIAVDRSGNVFVADFGNDRIQKFDSYGNFITKWGSSGTGDGQFEDPVGIAVDRSGNVFVVDWGNNRIQKFDSNGNFITTWGSKGTGDGEFTWPEGIAVDGGGNVYVTAQNNRIQKFDSHGNFITIWGIPGSGDGEFKGPCGITVDSRGNVFVVDWGNNRIQKFDSNGNFITKWGSRGSGDGEFKWPYDIAVDGSGNVFVADTNNNRIQKFAPGIQPIHTGYNGKIMDHETSGDTTPGDIIKGWTWVKNTGRYAKFKGTFEIKDPMGNTYYDSKTEIINSGTAHKFEGVDGLGIRIPSDTAIGEYWNSRFILYVYVGYWEEVDSTSWEPFKIKSADEPELHRDTPDGEALRVLYGEEVSFSVNVYNADCVKWLVDNHYMDTTTDVSDGVTSWRHSFYEDCTVTARAYRVEKSSEPVNWKIEIRTPPPAHYPQIYGYSPGDRSLKLNPGDTVDFKVQVKDDEGDLDRVIWEVDGAERHADDVYGKIVESRFHYVAEEGAKEVKATVYDLQGNSDSISWDVEPAVIVGDGPSVSILSITPSDTTPDPGEAITLSVSTRNDGIAGTADIGMTVIDPSGDACDLQWKEAEYTVGETKTFDFLYDVPSEGGGYNVISKSWDDCTGDCGSDQCCDQDTCECVGEQDGLTKPNAFDVVIPEGPDLNITSEDISFSNFNPAVGEVITITAVIHNIGTENANKVIVQFFDGDPANGGIQIGDDQVIDQIAAGVAKSTQIDWTVSSITNIHVKVDPNDDIKEMNEGNNIAHRLVSIAISPEAFIDTLKKIISYQNEISAYVGDNSAEMFELAFIYAIPYPLQDKEKKEQLEKKIIKNIPRLEIEQEQQKFENFYIFLDDIKEGEVITFTPDEKGTKVKVGDNSEYLVEDVYFDIPYDKITLEKEVGKISLTVEKDTEEIFSTALELLYLYS